MSKSTFLRTITRFMTLVVNSTMIPPMAMVIVLVGGHGSNLETWIDTIAILFFGAAWAAMTAAEAEREALLRENDRMARFLLGITSSEGGEFTFIIEHRKPHAEDATHG